MANIKSAKKRIKQNIKRKARNVEAKSAMNTAIKKALAAITSKSGDIKALVKKAVSIIDKCVERGILHKNTSARKKSRLVKAFNRSQKK